MDVELAFEKVRHPSDCARMQTMALHYLDVKIGHSSCSRVAIYEYAMLGTDCATIYLEKFINFICFPL